MIQKLLAQFRRQVCLSVVEKGSDVVLECAFAAPLVVKEIRPLVAEHHIARLEIAIEEVIVRCGQQKPGEAVEVVFERLLVEGNSGETEKVVLEVVQVPGNRLAIEARARVADLVVQVASGLNLEARQGSNDTSVCFEGRRCNDISAAIAVEKFKERDVPEVFLKVGVARQILS